MHNTRGVFKFVRRWEELWPWKNVILLEPNRASYSESGGLIDSGAYELSP